MVGAKGWQSAHCGLGSAPWALGTGASRGMGLGRPQVWEDGPSWVLTHSDPCLPAWAEVAPRSKRRCVLERKQPYSGDEWCSGPDSEEDDKPLGAAHSECPCCQDAVAHGVPGEQLP